MSLPILWHLKASHYNEKARWALDYKQVAHLRRAAVPGRHRAIAQRLAGGTTFPVLTMDGDAIGDSTAIIELLERRYPEPPLYPADPLERRRALELEDFFDEELGPYSRLLFLHQVLPDAKLTIDAFVPDLRGPRHALAHATFPLARRRAMRAFGINAENVAVAYKKVTAAGERFRTELQPSGYLVGDLFTIADLTLASLVAPIVCPPQFPYPQPHRRHPLLAPLREALAREGLLYWAGDIYARHRGTSAELAATGARGAILH